MAESLFDQNDNQQFDENKDYLSELIGPGGKFDVAKYNGNRDEAIKAMAKGKAFADRTLTHKLTEFDELREEYLKVRAENTAQAKFQDLLTQMESRGNNNAPASTPSGNVEQPSIDPQQLRNLIASEVQGIETSKRETENLNKVDTRLRESFGDNAKSVLRDKMNTLGISDEDLKFLAKKSPEAVFNALGLNQQQEESFQSPARSTLRSDTFSPKSDVRDAVYYEKMRREDPKMYFSEKTSVQRLKDMDSPDFLKRYQSRT